MAIPLLQQVLLRCGPATPQRWLAAPLPGFLAGIILVLAGGCAYDGAGNGSAPAGSHQVIGGAIDQPTVFMVGGSVTKVDRDNLSLTIQTPMNLSEAIRFNAHTQLSDNGARSRRWSDLIPGMPVKVDYEVEPDGGVLARRITLGASVALCPCGPDCRCPPSRGCRVIRTVATTTPASGP